MLPPRRRPGRHALPRGREDPGRTVTDAKNYTGRSGIGLSFKERDGRTVWVFDKKSLGFLGSADEALLAVGVADKAGQTPAR